MTPVQTGPAPEAGGGPRRVLVVLPSPLMARNFLRSSALVQMTGERLWSVTIVSPDPADRVLAESLGAQWAPYFHPRRWREPEASILDPVIRGARYARYLLGLALHMSLTYRFNTMAGFQGFAMRLGQSWSQRRIYLREGLPMSPVLGFPLPRGRRIFAALQRFYFGGWQGFGPVDQLLRDVRPDLVVLSMIQTHMVTPYALAARRAGVPVLGINGSWDQPTTKGPLCPGVSRIVVQNGIVRDELVRYHGVAPDRIDVIGWLQMDGYASEAGAPRAEVLLSLGLPPKARYVLFAANAPRLGSHEPAVVRELAERVRAGEFGPDVHLICRCHPQDRHWESRWGWVASLPGVVLDPPDLGPLARLRDMIRQAAVVVASAGSINLDAVALDTPTIGLAWEDAGLPWVDRPARAYELEHLRELRQHDGIWFASTAEQLAQGCARYLADRDADAAGRARLRERYLHRLDGLAASRLVATMSEMLS